MKPEQPMPPGTQPEEVAAQKAGQPHVAALVNRLRAASVGHEEWRIQSPEDGAYCLAFSRGEWGVRCLNPEREARQWLAESRRRDPCGRYAGFEVACVYVQTDDQLLMLQAASALDVLAKRLGD